MLKITIPAMELFDEKTQEFVSVPETELELEHSLISLSKWESKWCKPFLSKEEKTIEETLDYIKCMTLTPDVDPTIYNYLSQNNIEQINKYIEAPMTATTFRPDPRNKANREIVTAELIYYWMVGLNIPFECQDWHLNRLLTLIRVCSVKNQPAKKMSRREVMSQNAALNAQRKAMLGTKG